jgi:hypothetical protein
MSPEWVSIIALVALFVVARNNGTDPGDERNWSTDVHAAFG